MAKKLKKDTTIAKAKSLKTNVTRKFAVGGVGDPPVIPAKPAANQPFTQHYQDNAADFNAADSAARSYMTDWFTKRAAAFPEKHGAAANAMGEYLQKSGQGVYIPEPEVPEGKNPEKAFENMFSGIKMKDAEGFANTADYSPVFAPNVPNAVQTALKKDKFSTPNEPRAKISATDTPLTYNTAYYRGDYGKRPTTQLEEQLHLASSYGEHMSPNHAKSFSNASDYINPGNIKKMEYKGMKGNEDYYGDTQEFYPRLMSARRTFGLKPDKEYTKDEMSDFLNKGYNDIINNNFTEPGQKEHLIQFYTQLGYPTPSAGFTKGASEEEIRLQKEAAAEKFRKSNHEFAMQKNQNIEDYGLPQAARYGGYKYEKGGPGKKKEKAANKKAMGGFEDPEDPEKPWRHKIKSEDGNYLYNRVGTNAIQDYDKSTVRRTLKGFITGAPKPKKTIPRTSDAKFAEGGMNKNMLNANSTTGPRSEHSWQDPGVNRFSGNTNGVNADYYFKKGGLKSKVSSKFAKLKL